MGLHLSYSKNAISNDSLKKESCNYIKWKYVLQLHQVHRYRFRNYSEHENMCGALGGWAQTYRSLSTEENLEDKYSKLSVTSKNATKCN